jgi:DNA modification methylase
VINLPYGKLKIITPFGNSSKEETWGYGTQKPMECMLRPILNNSAQGESVYDPFGGSGTTLIACERSKRNCYMMELSPAYVDVIIKRWEKETNKKTVLLNEEKNKIG